MARSLWKGPFVDSFLLKKSKKILTQLAARSANVGNVGLENTKLANNALSAKNGNILPEKNLRFQGPIRIWSRRSFILPEFIDQFFEIYNGKQFISFQVNEDMVGHKFGEFAATRKKALHKKKIKGK